MTIYRQAATKLVSVPVDTVTSGSLSARHGEYSGCGWRNGLQTRRVAANILNKQSQRADKGRSFSLGVARGANNSSPKNINYVTKYSKKPQDQTGPSVRPENGQDI